MEASPDGDKNTKSAWLYVGLISVFFLALFWSVDVSIVYFLSAIAVFCFFQYLRSEVKGFQWQQKKTSSYKKEARPNTRDDVLREIQKGFQSSGRTLSPNKLLRTVLTFIGLFFAFVFIRAFFSNDVTDSQENYYVANDFYDRGEYDSAAYYYRLASLENPGDAEIYYGRGNAFRNLNQYDSAIILYDQALALDSHHTNAMYYKGYTLYQQKRYREAVDATSQILVVNPNDQDAMLLIGDCYYSQTQYEKALEWYTVVYEGGYRSAILSHIMAYIYDTRGKTAEAIEFYQEAIGLDSTNVDVLIRLGELFPGEEGNVYRTKALQLSRQSN